MVRRALTLQNGLEKLNRAAKTAMVVPLPLPSGQIATTASGGFRSTG